MSYCFTVDLCVKLPDRWGNIDMQTASKIREFCFLCPQCCYSKRPGLSVIVVLLHGLQPLRLRLLEGLFVNLIQIYISYI